MSSQSIILVVVGETKIFDTGIVLYLVLCMYTLLYVFICDQIHENQAYGIIINFEIRVKIDSYGLLG